MTKHKLFVPGVSFVAGLVLWIIYLFWNGNATEPNFLGGIIFSVAVAVLFVYSAIQCRIATGGRLGNRVRAVVLLVMTVITFFQAGAVPAGILFLTAIIIGIIAYNSTELEADSNGAQA